MADVPASFLDGSDAAALPRWHRVSYRVPLAAFVVLYVVAYAVALPPFLRGHERDFGAFYRAAGDMLAHRDIYDPATNGRYIYPPLLAFLFQPLALLPMPAAAAIWLAVSTGAYAGLALLITSEFFRRLAPAQVAAAPEGSRKTIFYGVAFVGSLLASKALYSEINLGQCDVFLLLAFFLALRWVDRHPILAGMALGFAANIKYLPLVFLPYLLVRRRFLAGLALAAAFYLGLLVPALSTGLSVNLQQQRSSLGLLSHVAGGGAPGAHETDIQGLTWDHSVSLSSAAARFADAVSLPQKPVVVVAGLLILGVCGVWFGRWYHRAGLRMFRAPSLDSTAAYQPAVILEWLALITLALALSPQTTTRHMILLLPVSLMVARTLLLPPRDGRSGALLVVTVLLFLGMILPPNKFGLQTWRNIGGVSWLSLATLLLLVPSTLRCGRRAGLSQRS